MMPSAKGITKGPPVDPRTPFRHFQSSTAAIAPTNAPAMLCDSVGVALRSVLNDPASHAPIAPPMARLTK